MPTFRYQAYTSDGKSVKGRQEGPSLKAVRDDLLSKGILVRSIQPVTQGKAKKATPAVRSILYRELSALLNAGLPLDRALEILAEHPELAADGDVLPAVRDRVREGGEFSESLKAQLPGLREEEAAVLAAGEAAGTLAKVSSELADSLEIESELQDQARTALVYPMIITVLAFLVLGVIVGYLLPTYEQMLGDADVTLPLLTRFLLGAGRWIRSPLGVLSFLVLVAGAVFGIKRLKASASDALSEKIYQLPALGPVLSSRVRARFARTLALLLEGGVPLPQAVEGAGRATGSRWLALKCAEASGGIAQGMRVAQAVSQIPVLQEDLPGWIRAGEASGDLPDLLRHAATGHERSWKRGVDRLLALLEPALIIAVGLIILMVAMAVLLPMLRMNQVLTGS